MGLCRLFVKNPSYHYYVLGLKLHNVYDQSPPPEGRDKVFQIRILSCGWTRLLIGLLVNKTNMWKRTQDKTQYLTLTFTIYTILGLILKLIITCCLEKIKILEQSKKGLSENMWRKKHPQKFQVSFTIICIILWAGYILWSIRLVYFSRLQR